MYALQVTVIPAQSTSLTGQFTEEYHLPDHLVCENDNVINYISVNAETVPQNISQDEENSIQIAKEYPEVADETNEVIIKLILVILIGVILLVIIGFAVALFLFFGGFI